MSRRPPEDRGAVVFLHKDGLTTPEICRMTGFERRFVTRWISRYNDSGSLDDARGAGRKETLKGCGADFGEEKAEKMTPLKSRERKKQKVGDVSYKTVQRTVHRRGLLARF